MLVLTRKLNQIVRIGDGITVRVLRIHGNQIKLGIGAPADVRIWRDEVYQRRLDAAQATKETNEEGLSLTVTPP